MQAKGAKKMDSEESFWAQEGWEWGVLQTSHWGTP